MHTRRAQICTYEQRRRTIRTRIELSENCRGSNPKIDPFYNYLKAQIHKYRAEENELRYEDGINFDWRFEKT